MALWLRDGFDFYNTTADALLGGFWAGGSTGGALSSVTRFGYGQSLGGSSVQLNSPVFTNQSTVFACFSCWGNNSASNAEVRFLDGGSTQCRVLMSGTSILIYSGSGTLIETIANAVQFSQWNQLQIKVVINATTGEVHIRKNGNTSDDYVFTGINTAGGTGAAQANSVDILANGSGLMDDFAAWDSTGSAPWNNWVGDIRCFPAMPNADTAQLQWTPNNAGNTTFGHTTSGSTGTATANTLYMYRFVPTCGGTLGNIALTLNTSGLGNINIGLYEANAISANFIDVQGPYTLLNICTPINNPPSGVNTFTWTSSPVLQNGAAYYLAILADFSASLKLSTTNVERYSIGVTYSGGAFPSIVSGYSGTSTSFPVASGLITANNAGLVNDWAQDGSTTFISDGNIGDFDLYTIPPPPTTPSSILGVTLKAMVSKSDAGTRTYCTHLRSGGTDVDLTTYSPNTSYNYQTLFQDTDPNTGLAWTVSGVSALLIGPKVNG